MPSVLNILYSPDAAPGGVPGSSASGVAASPSTKCFPLHLTDTRATVIEHLPFDDVVSSLDLAPSAHYTAALYPFAVLVDSDSAKEYPLSNKNILVAGRPAARMVFRRVSTAHTLTLRLGERDSEEWESVQKAQDEDDFEQWEEEGTPAPSTPSSPESSSSTATPPPYKQRVQPAPAFVSAAPSFMISSSDVEVASVLCMAMEQSNPLLWLHHLPARWETPAVSSLLTDSGDRVSNVSDAAQPYLLALSRNDSTVYKFGDKSCQQQLEGDTLWVAFPSGVAIDDSRATLRMLGPSSSTIGRVYGPVHSRVQSILPHIRAFAAEYRKRRALDGAAKPWRVIFTGHSVGGTLAQVACLQLLSESLLDVLSSEQVGVISFASPLVVSDDVRTHLCRQSWNDHFLTVVEQADVIPHLLTSAFDFDLDRQQVEGHQSQAAIVSKALAGLLVQPNPEATSQLGNVSRLVAAPGRQNAASTFTPVGVYAMIQSHSELSSRQNWRQVHLYDDAGDIGRNWPRPVRARRSTSPSTPSSAYVAVSPASTGASSPRCSNRSPQPPSGRSLSCPGSERPSPCCTRCSCRR